jgi:hypothetical protein
MKRQKKKRKDSCYYTSLLLLHSLEAEGADSEVRPPVFSVYICQVIQR